MSHNALTTFGKAWVLRNSIVYPLALGILHPLISHGFLGDHGVYLTPPQLIMHTLAILLFGVLLSIAQNKSLRLLHVSIKPLDGALPMSLLITAFFWTGYYTLYIPFDILFMMLTIGGINAVRLRPYMKQPRKWAWQSMLTYFLGAAAGIAVGTAAFFGGVKDIPGLGRDLVLWLFISTPAGLVSALVSGRFLKAQMKVPGNMERKEPELQSWRNPRASRPAHALPVQD